MSTESRKGDSEFEERAKQLFDESVDRLDARTRSKLTQARYRALEQLTAPAGSVWRRPWAPAGAAAAALTVLLVLWLDAPERTVNGTFDMAATSDLELLLAEEELEMIQELEFYAWLEEQVELGDAQGVEDGVG